MAVSNLINGVDWYSLSDLAFLSTTKLPAGAAFYPSSGITYIKDGASVVLGGADGSAHILSRDKGAKNLEHHGTSPTSHQSCSNLGPQETLVSYNQRYVALTTPGTCSAYFHGLNKAFAPNVKGQGLIAAGTDGLHGQATVIIWMYTEKRAKSRISVVTIQRLIPAVSLRREPLCIT